MRQTGIVSRREMLLAASSVIAGGRIASAQWRQASPAPTFSADVNVVNVFVTVRDKKGNIVKDLTQEDFTLAEDGREQTIRYFSRESNLPLTIGLIVDMTPSETNMLEEERSASRAFLNKMLRPDMDKAFLIQFGDEVELLQDVTSSREKLDEALNLLKRQESGGRSRGGRPGSPGGGPGGGGGANSTALSDAIFLASDEIMKKQVGRKALFILGDGDHIGSREEMAITAAEQADTLVYAIRIYDRSLGSRGGGWGGGGIPGMGGPSWGGGPGTGGRGGGRGGPGGGGPGGGPGRSDGKEGLQRLARKTGGSYFEVSKKTSLDDIYAKIEEELRSQYSLGYTPSADARDGYRKIKIDVRKKGMVVQGREGYYPATS